MFDSFDLISFGLGMIFSGVSLIIYGITIGYGFLQDNKFNKKE
jgi:hypothetical protein